MEEIIERRLGKRTLGFAQTSHTGEEFQAESSSNLARVASEDIIDFGLIPEFVGRLPVIAALSDLSIDDMVRILKEPRNSLVKQYTHLFGMDNAELVFTPEALRTIAHLAKEKRIGARGLRSIMEEIMLDILFEMPDQPTGVRYVIDEDVVLGRRKLFNFEESKVKLA